MPGFWANARVRSPRTGFAENTVLRAGSWAKCLDPREADLEARVLPKCQETAVIRATTRPAVVKCKFRLVSFAVKRPYTHRAVAGSRFPSTMPLHLKESFEYRLYSRFM